MSYNGKPIELNAQNILKLIGEAQIFKKYLGFSIDNEYHKNPLRNDNSPSCKFYWNGYKWKFNDPAIAFNEDCFGIVMAKYRCSFGTALNIIAGDFGLKNANEKINPQLVELAKIPEPKQGETIIKIKPRFWTKRDVDYWTSYYLDSRDLEWADCVSIESAYIKTNRSEYNLIFSPTDLAFAYQENGFYKIYQPEKTNSTGKWISNIPKRYYHGYRQLPEFTDIIVVTKSMKDVTVLHSLGVAAISPQSESGTISFNGYQLLYNRSKYLFSLFDYDLAGIKCAKRHKKLYTIKPLFITTGEKDISGFIKANGVKRTKALIEYAKTIVL